MMRDSLIFYQSFAKAIKRLPEEDQLRALWSIIDYGLDGTNRMIGMKMPVRYVVEMFLDRMAASKIYRGKAYTDSDPLQYFLKGGRENYVMHPETKALLEQLLVMLEEEGEEKTYDYIRAYVLKEK